MRLDDLTHVLRRLQAEKVRFLIAGGLAVVAHGHMRVTHDLDLVLAMDPDNLVRALAVFAGLGFTPRLPVSLEDFADPEKRAVWIDSKGMQVFSLVSAVHRSLVVDIFASAPFPFDAEWDRASWIAFPDASLRLPFVCRATLIRMKQEAGRPVDREDVAHLQSLPDEAS
jgi:hypothetical protein